LHRPLSITRDAHLGAPQSVQEQGQMPGQQAGLLALVDARATMIAHQRLRQASSQNPSREFGRMPRQSPARKTKRAAGRNKSAARKKNKTKTASEPARPKQQQRAPKVDAIDALMIAGAQALALPLEEAFKAGVKSNLQALLTHAALVDAFFLPDDVEPAPVFRA
jgi:hypothetical protein